MNLFKKATATLALVALLSGIFSTGVSAASTAEIEAANYLAKAGIIVDHTDNPTAYNLDQNVLRQEIAAVARGIAGLDKKTTCDGVFRDVSATNPNNWACYTVEQLADNGLIALNENFRPEDNISKAEGIGMIVKAAFGNEYEYDPTLATTWQEQVVAFAVANGVTNSFTNYDTPATRGFVFAAWANAMEAAIGGDGEDIDKIMCELLGICEETPANPDNTQSGSTTTPVITSGNVEITLNPKSPVAQTIPSSGLVPFGKFDFTAGREDVKIDSVTLKREGLSQRTDIRRLYFERNGIRVSNRASVSIDELANVTFTPALTIRAGSTETLDLIVELREPANGNDTGATVGAEHRFSIAGSSDITASTTVGGTFPLRTALMRVGSYVVEKVEVNPIWGGTDNASDTTFTVGTENALLTEFQLITNGDRNNIFKSVTFRNWWDGDASSSLANIGIYKDGTKISSEVSIVGRDVTVYVNDLILNGRSENYQLRADVTWAERTNENYQFEIRNTSDLTVVEEESGFSAPIDLTRVTGWTSHWATVTVEWGDFLISRDTAYTLNQTVSASTNDVVLYAAKINVAEEISIEDVLIKMETGKGGYGHASGSLMDFSSLRFLVGDATVATYTPIQADANSQSFIFESSFNVRPGASTIKITWNLRTNVTNGAMYRVSWVTLWGTSGEMRYVSNDEKVTPSGSAQGIATTVADGGLSFTRNDGIDNYTIVPGSTDKVILGFSARANDVSDVKITWMRFTMTGTSIDESAVSNIRLYQDGKLVTNGTKNNFDFNSLDITLTKNTTANFQLLADFSNAIGIGEAFRIELLPTGVNARNLSSNQTVTPGGVMWVPFTFSDGGALKVTANSSQVQRSILTPSSSETSVFKFDLQADDDNVMVTDIFVTGTMSGTGTVADAVRSSSLFINGRSYAGSIVGNNKIHFAIGTNGVIVRRDETMTWDVRIALHDSQTRSSVTFDLGILANDNGTVNGTRHGIRALSESTGKEIIRDDGSASDVKSNSHLLARSKPTVAMANFTASSSDIYRFTITADSNRKITLDSINLDLGGSATLTGGTIKIFRDSQTANNEVFTKLLNGTSSTNDQGIALVTSTGAGTSTWTKYTTTATITGTIDVNDVYTITVDGTPYSHTVAANNETTTTIAASLVAKIGASASGSTNVVTIVADDVTGAAPVYGQTATDAGVVVGSWVPGTASKEIAAGQTVTFYVTVENSTWYISEQTRETRVTEVVYKDDVVGAVWISASLYNTGLPTTTSSYKY